MKSFIPAPRSLFSSLLLFFGFVLAGRAQTILPDATVGQAYSFQIVTNPPQPAGTAYSADGLPVGLSIDSSTGVVSGETGTVGVFKGNLYLALNSTTTTYPYQITVDPAAGSPTITSSGSLFGTVGTPFSYTIEATNGPTSYNIAQLPPGLTASGSQITGTPTASGLFFTSISANNQDGQGAILVLMFTMSAAGPVPAITSSLLVSSAVGAPFSYNITATNSPTSFSATGLPAGLSLNASTGLVSGTPTSPQVAIVSITAANNYGSSPPLNLTLTIGAFSVITSATSVSTPAGTPFSYTLTASNSPENFNVSGLPAGLSFTSTTGLISGTPTTAGTYTLTASANNTLGTGPATPITLTVTGSTGGGLTAPQIIVQPQPQSVTVGSTVQFSVTAAGSGALSYQWSFDGTPISGATASALSIGSVGQANAGSYTVTVTNAAGAIVSSPASLAILSVVVPPSITAQPSDLSTTVGSTAGFTVGASGTPPLSYQWYAGGTAIAGATTATLTLPNVQVSAAGTYSVVVNSPTGSATSRGAVLTVSATLVAPIFQYQPTSTAVTVGGTASFSVGIVGSPPITYQWSKNGTAITGATLASFTLPAVAASDAGTYAVVITNPAGSVTSSNATLTVQPAGGPPVPVSIVQQPVPVSTTIGGGATFSVAVTGDATVTYQWRKNQSPIAGATSPSFVIADVQTSDAGTYDVMVANGFSATISFPTPLTVTPVSSPSRLTNVSARGFSGAGAQSLFIGFVVEGTGATQALVRAVGPSLSAFGLTGLLADPQLSLYSSTGAPVASNDNWGGTAALTTAFAQVGAFPLSPASLDAAVLTTLQPGSYSAQVTGTNGGTGVVLLEAYDADGGTPAAHFVNVSGRGFSGGGSNVLTVGFVVTGNTSTTVLVRGIGPTLTSFSVAGAIANPQVTVFDSNQNVIGSNAGWGGTAALQAAFNAVSAFPLPTTSSDAALLVTLAPGAYTAEVTGVNGSTGIALLEVYQMP